MDQSVLDAAQIITDIGSPGVLTEVIERVIDGPTGAVLTPGSEVHHDVRVYRAMFTESEVDGSQILKSDLKLLVDSLTVEPQVGWDIIVGDKKCRIMDVLTRWFNGQAIFYVCQARAQ